ncbi:hepcidin-1-like [Bufo bufo]|uniref:hepcidin-1-like n=1 Tax=Bufo bufo TaxID=8384 RepID=UPI001ABE39F7|nr:hepcidin-1-like [Bufo bufo]
MKSFALCIILIVSMLCHCSQSVSKNENRSMISSGNLPQMEESSLQEPLARGRRHLGLSLCIYCCKCCRYKGCGYCCRT